MYTSLMQVRVGRIVSIAKPSIPSRVLKSFLSFSLSIDNCLSSTPPSSSQSQATYRQLTSPPDCDSFPPALLQIPAVYVRCAPQLITSTCDYPYSSQTATPLTSTFINNSPHILSDYYLIMGNLCGKESSE